MTRPMDIEIRDILSNLRTGEAEMIYARWDKRSGAFYCTIKPRKPTLPGLKPLWLDDQPNGH